LRVPDNPHRVVLILEGDEILTLDRFLPLFDDSSSTTSDLMASGSGGMSLRSCRVAGKW
jgi:hypothetical protein